MTYTHDYTHRAFYERAWDILVQHAGAPKDPDTKLSFVEAFTQVEHPAIEWRFQGLLGFGGKFWRTDGRFFIRCYPEDSNKSRERIISSVNQRLSDLALELKPNPNGP